MTLFHKILCIHTHTHIYIDIYVIYIRYDKTNFISSHDKLHCSALELRTIYKQHQATANNSSIGGILTMNAHVSNIARTCYYELRRLASIRRFLTSTATATFVSAFVLSRIDYCNSLLFGSTNDVTSHLQRIQNYAARVIFCLPMSSSITIHLKSLHWLPVKVRSTYKIACLCYHCHSSTAPSYVTDMLHIKPLHTRNTRSSSYTMPLLNRPAHSKATLGDRSFSFASSSVWNSIPNDVRCAPSLSSFKSRLKTYLFRSVYID